MTKLGNRFVPKPDNIYTQIKRLIDLDYLNNDGLVNNYLYSYILLFSNFYDIILFDFVGNRTFTYLNRGFVVKINKKCKNSF